MPLFKAETLQIDTDDTGIALMKIDVPDRSVNVITPQMLNDLNEALNRLSQESTLKVLVIRGMKPSGFIAGADIQEFAKINSPQEAIDLSRRGQELFNKLELLPIPTLAIIHGACLGGGLELALACDYRLVVDDRKTQLGLPETRLGLLPAWGGTQRLPRVVGLEASLKMILGAKMLHGREAKKWKLADAIAKTDADLRVERDRLLDRAKSIGKRPKQSLPYHGIRQKLIEFTNFGRRMIFNAAAKLLKRKVPDDMPALNEALEAVKVGIKQGINAGLAQEREAAGRLAMTPACHHLVNVFLQREAARKTEDHEKSRVHRVGVVGAGTMGAGIAQLAAMKDHEVIVQEVDDSALGKGVLAIEKLFQEALLKGVISPKAYAEKINSVKGSFTWDGFAGLDLVIEAALEDIDVKKGLFKTLEEKTRANAVLATNTSSLSVSVIQQEMEYPERMAGLHFFNPVHKMELIEVIRGEKTDEKTVNTLLRWAKELGKTPVLVKDSPGFLVNRILTPYLNEAVLLLLEGMDVIEIDRIMKRFGMPMMGPLELLDQVGLDIAAHIAASIQPHFGDRFPTNPAFERMKGTEWLGKKSGAGFYRYRRNKKKVNKHLLRVIRQESLSTDLDKLTPSVRATQARERMVLLMVNEAAACLDEQVIADAQQLDLAMILGTGWAPHRGGPLHYADDRGIAAIVETLQGYAERYGVRFSPCEKLKQMAARGQSFYSERS